MSPLHLNSIASRFRSRRDIGSRSFGRDAISFWRIACLLTLLSLLGIMLWSSALYRRIERDEFASKMRPNNASGAFLDRQKLQDTLRALDARRARFDDILSGQ